MRKFTLLVFLSVIFAGYTFAQESFIRAKSKHLAKETHTPLIDNATNKVNLEVLNKAEKSSAFYEGFENWDPENPSALPSGWEMFRTSTLTETPSAAVTTWPWAAINPDNDPYDGVDYAEFVFSGDGALFCPWQAQDFTWAITPAFNLAGDVTDLAYLTYWHRYLQNETDAWFTNYHVMVQANGSWTVLRSFMGEEVGTNDYEEMVGIDISAYIGQTVKLAFVHEWNDGIQMAIDEIDAYVLPNYDNGINSVFYQFYQWWPASVDKEMRFDLEVGGGGTAPGMGEVSLYVNDQLLETQELENMLFGMNDVDTFFWTPETPGTYNLRFQLSDELDDGDGNMVPDENPANNILELTFDIPDPETVLFTEGFEHVDWDNPDGASAIFPPSDDWLFTEGWGVTTSRAMRDLISASVLQFNGDPEEVLITPGMNLPAGDVKIEMVVGGLNNGIDDPDDGYLGHSTLKVYLLDALPAKDLAEETLLLTYELDSLVGDSPRNLALDLAIETEGTYYLQFVTTSTFNFDGFFSGVFLDNIMIKTVPTVIMHDVIFNVDVTDLAGFDPATHNVYMTGTPTNWAVPGTEGSVTMTRDAAVTESIIYTTTVSIEDGSDVAYKYFSDLVGQGWDGGEWAGEPNREVTITDAVTIDDTWAVYGDVSVYELTDVQNLMVYPNPVREKLTIINGENISTVRIFDVTGRVVFNADINAATTEINVSDFNEGVYVVQIISGNELTSRKINIVK